MERQRMDRLNIQRKLLRDNLNPFELRDREFVRLFRADKETARYLINCLRPRLSSLRVDGLSVEIKILVSLRFLGHGSYQRPVGQGFFIAMSQPSVSRALEAFTKALYAEFLNEVIRFPSTDQERQDVQTKFMERADFPGILGCIDCSHVAIFTPFHQENAYKNHYGFYSLNVQMVCDSELRILNVNANFPGTVHDQFIFNASVVKEEMIRLEHERVGQFFLLGDSGYSVQPYMLTPVLNAVLESPEDRYTKQHCRVRNRIERCFGVLKGRFRCIKRDRVLHYRPEKCGYIVIACAILHNMLLRRVPWPEVAEVVPVADIFPDDQGPNYAQRNARRADIIRRYFS